MNKLHKEKGGKMKKLSIILAIMLSLVSFAFVGCKKNNSSVIRVNEVTHSIFYAPFYVAINKGYFENEGISIELTNGGGSNNSMTALITNGADVALLGPETAVYTYAQGAKDQPVIFGQLTKRDGSFMFTRDTNENFSWNNVVGKEILAGRRGGMPYMALEYLLKQKGLLDKTNLNTDVAFANMASAYQGGQGDYTTLFEPTASDMASNGLGKIVASIGEEVGEVPYTAFMATKSFMEKNPKTIKAFLRAVWKGYNFLVNAPIEDVADALSPSFDGTSKQNIQAAITTYKSIDAWVSNPAMTQDSYDRLCSIMTSAGELSVSVPMNAIVDNSYANEVMKELLDM